MATSIKNLSEYDKANISNGADYKIGIVVSEWNEAITSKLLDGALQTFQEHGVRDENLLIKSVPGAFELPLGAQMMLDSSILNLDGVIAIGSVIRGETAHFDYVCSAAAQGIKDVGLKTGKPVSFWVLTDDNEDQTRARS